MEATMAIRIREGCVIKMPAFCFDNQNDVLKITDQGYHVPFLPVKPSRLTGRKGV
jgi:hypothetical protein